MGTEALHIDPFGILTSISLTWIPANGLPQVAKISRRSPCRHLDLTTYFTFLTLLGIFSLWRTSATVLTTLDSKPFIIDRGTWSPSKWALSLYLIIGCCWCMGPSVFWYGSSASGDLHPHMTNNADSCALFLFFRTQGIPVFGTVVSSNLQSFFDSDDFVRRSCATSTFRACISDRTAVVWSIVVESECISVRPRFVCLLFFLLTILVSTWMRSYTKDRTIMSTTLY